jgi:hypothetical protein
MIDLIFIILAIINASIPEQNLPIDLEVSPVPTEGDAAATNAGAGDNNLLNAGLITSILGLVGGLFATYTKNKKETKQVAERTDAVADSTVNVHQSLKSTDKGNEDTASLVAQLANKLKSVKSIEEIPAALESFSATATENAEEWKKDNKEYYENKPPVTSADVGLDKTRAKLVQVNKESKPTPDL